MEVHTPTWRHGLWRASAMALGVFVASGGCRTADVVPSKSPVASVAEPKAAITSTVDERDNSSKRWELQAAPVKKASGSLTRVSRPLTAEQPDGGVILASHQRPDDLQLPDPRFLLDREESINDAQQRDDDDIQSSGATRPDPSAANHKTAVSGYETPQPPELVPPPIGDRAARGTDQSTAPSEFLCHPCKPLTIDICNALRLGGADNEQIRWARARVVEAHGDWLAARATRLPSLLFGIGYNRHDGLIQATPGDILSTSRDSLFVGGGASLGSYPLAGGAGGPVRLQMNLALADAIFSPLIARNLKYAACSEKSAVYNDSLLEIAEAYYDLVEAYALLATSQYAWQAADDILQLANQFADVGKAAQSEVYRLQTDRLFWDRRRQENKRAIAAATARLTRLISLDCCTRLLPAEEHLAPVELIPESTPCNDLIAAAYSCRPEVAQFEWLIVAAQRTLRRERLRPFMPDVNLGYGAGLFGGSRAGGAITYGGRGDLDVQALWQLNGLGLGYKAARVQSKGRLAQTLAQAELIRDRICEDVKVAYGDIHSYRQQLEIAQTELMSAENTYQTTLERIKAGEGLPLELLQSIQARQAAQAGLVSAISDYNRAQFRLLRAVGRAPDANAACCGAQAAACEVNAADS